MLQLRASAAAWALPSSTRALPARPARGVRHVVHTADGMNWLTQLAADVEAQELRKAASAAAAAADDTMARSVGLHLRGRMAFNQGMTDEDDPKRHVFHKELKQDATNGHYQHAEVVLEEMGRQGFVPGPRAYHALVFSYVKAQEPSGALGAIRRCWDAGVVPLPETYAAVVHAHVAAGDLETAEAVLASNRRAGVDCTQSWQLLVAALLRGNQAAKGMEVYSQGIAEGLDASEGVCQVLIEHHCTQQDLAGATAVLERMVARGLRPSTSHYAPLIVAHAEHGDPQEAYRWLQQYAAVDSKGTRAAPLCNLVLEALLEAAQSTAEVAVAAHNMREILGKPGPAFYRGQLTAALRLQDMQAAMQAFRLLRTQVLMPLQSLDDDVLAALLLQLSSADLPADIYEVLAAMSREGRAIPQAALEPDEHGCSILGAWVRRRRDHAAALQDGLLSEQEAPAVQVPAALAIDGVQFDPQTLMCLDDSGMPLAVGRMGVKQLRAELAARRAPVTGNKKELARRLQKVRQLDATRTSSSAGLSSEQPKEEEKKKVNVVVTDLDWEGGGLAEEIQYQDEREMEALAEEEGEEGAEWDMEEEGEGPSLRRAALEDDMVDDEDDDMGPSSGDMEEGYMLSSYPRFTSQWAGPHEAAAVLLGAAADLQAAPTPADLAAVGAWVLGTSDVAACVLLAAAIDRLPTAVEGAAALRGQLSGVCMAGGVDLDAAVEVLLRSKVQEQERDESFEAEFAEFAEVV